MIQMQVEKASVKGVVDYFERMRRRMINAIRDGMQESMQGLAERAVTKMSEAGIVTHRGELATSILRSVRVKVGAKEVRGTVGSNVRQLPIGLWLNFGTHYPRKSPKRLELRVPPRPFMNPALAEYKQQIVETIATRLKESVQ